MHSHQETTQTLSWLGSGSRSPPVPPHRSFRGATSGHRSASNAPPHACHEGTRGPLSPPAWSLYSLHGAMHPTCMPAMKPWEAHVDPWSLHPAVPGERRLAAGARAIHPCMPAVTLRGAHVALMPLHRGVSGSNVLTTERRIFCFRSDRALRFIYTEQKQTRMIIFSLIFVAAQSMWTLNCILSKHIRKPFSPY